PGTTRLHESILAAPRREVDRVPRRVRSAEPVVVTDHRAALVVARPVVAGIGSRGAFGQSSVRVGSGEDVVHVRAVARTVDLLTLLAEGRRLADVVPVAFDVAVQVGHVLRDELALHVVPGARADPVARIDGRLAIGRRGAEVCTPRPIAGAGGLRQRLAVLVGSLETSEVATIAQSDARHEEAHGLWRALSSLT